MTTITPNPMVALCRQLRDMPAYHRLPKQPQTVEPMPEYHRVWNYLHAEDGNNRRYLTPRQGRRVTHKSNRAYSRFVRAMAQVSA